MKEVGYEASVAAEPERLDGLAAQGVLDELAATVGTEIESQLLIDVVADLVAGGIFHAFQNVLDFFQVVAVVFVAIRGRRIERGVNLDFYYVTEIILWIKFPLAQVT
jgi:hypothetical protein